MRIQTPHSGLSARPRAPFHGVIRWAVAAVFLLVAACSSTIAGPTEAPPSATDSDSTTAPATSSSTSPSSTSSGLPSDTSSSDPTSDDPVTSDPVTSQEPPDPRGEFPDGALDADDNAVVWADDPDEALRLLAAAVQLRTDVPEQDDDSGASDGSDADGDDPEAAPHSGLAILVPHAFPDGYESLADEATAIADTFGAALIPVKSDDPRADSEAIHALADLQPNRVIGFGPKFGTVDRFVTRVATATTGVELVGGGQVMFPGRTLVALYGRPNSTALGALGQQGLEDAIKRAKKVAQEYGDLVSGPVVPTFEIIATVAAASPGSDGLYSAQSTVGFLEPWVEAANEAGIYVILDLQPGRAKLLDQAKIYESLLKHPNVGLAIDPEWKLTKNQKPLEQIGSVAPGEINDVLEWLSGVVAENELPQKVLVLHQFLLSMLPDSHKIVTNDDNVAVLIHMDGQGSPGAKEGTWAGIVGAAPDGVFFGWKNFYVMDTPMISPEKTMNRDPVPVMISYQ